MAYDKNHYSDPHPMLYSIVAPAALRKLQREYKLPPAALLLLLTIQLVRHDSGNPTTAHLATGWLSNSLLREYVRKLEAAGYLQRLPLRRRAAKQLVLTVNGLSLVNHLQRDMREACRKLIPRGRWPQRY
ncbi:hypothetical protein ACW9KT_10805 [Hymenobacter sp. HD11105]